MAGNDSHGNYPHNHINSDDDIINVIDLDEELPDAKEFGDEVQWRVQVCDATIAGEIDDYIHCFLGHPGPVHSLACSPITSS